VLQSFNAADGLRELLSEARVVCGSATAARLGLHATIALGRFSASAALGALRPRVQPGERVLVPRAVEGREDLIGGLRDLGIWVDAPIAYRTAMVGDAAKRLGEGGVDVVTVCSPSAARSVAGCVSPGTRVVCLGDTTAEAARQSGLRVEGLATNTSMPALVAAVEAVLGARV
jgi:uroporphyrinogen-III synthase